MRKNILLKQIIISIGLMSVLAACNNGSSGGGSTPTQGGSVSVSAVQIPANYGNRGISSDHDIRVSPNNMALSMITSESNNIILGYNPLIASMANEQCFNYTTEIDAIRSNTKVNQASLSKTLSDHFAFDFSAKGSVSSNLNAGASLSYNGDAKSNSFSKASTYISQLSYPIKFSGFSLNSKGIAQATPELFGLNCGSNVVTSANGNVTVFIEILATSSSDSDSTLFNQALGGNFGGFLQLAESAGVANSQASSSANINVTATIIGGNATASKIITAVNEALGQQCLSTGNSSACEQWDTDIQNAIEAEQNSIIDEVNAGNIGNLHLDVSSVQYKHVSNAIPGESAVDPFSGSATGLKQLAKVLKTVNYISAKAKALRDDLIISGQHQYQVSNNYPMLNDILVPGYANLATNLNHAFNDCLQNGNACTLGAESISTLISTYSDQSTKDIPYLIHNFYALQTVATYNNQPNMKVLLDVPPGSYKQSCEDYKVNTTLNQLEAKCWTEGGWFVPKELKHTTLNYLIDCRPDTEVSNSNGTLTCDHSTDSASRVKLQGTNVSVTPLVVKNTNGSSIKPSLLMFNSHPYYENNISAINNNGVGILFNDINGLSGVYLNSDIIGQLYTRTIGQSTSPFYTQYKMINHSLSCDMEKDAGCSVRIAVGANCAKDGYTENGYYCSNENQETIYQQKSAVHIEYNSLFTPLVEAN